MSSRFHLRTALKKIIYVLKLKQDKYYVGHFNEYKERPETKIKTIFTPVSSWTRKYQPLEVLFWYVVDDLFVKDGIVMRFMYKFGVENVRGGTFIEAKLEKELIDYINLVFATVEGKCFECNKKGHFAIEHSRVNEDEHQYK